MVLFLYGDDIGEIQYKYRAILNQFQEKNKNQYTIKVFSRLLTITEGEQDIADVKKDTTSELLDFLKGVAIFDFKKLAVVNDFQEFTAVEQKQIYDFLSQTGFFQNKREFLLIRYNGLIKEGHKKIISEFLRHSTSQKFELPKSYTSIMNKIDTVFSRFGLKIETLALSFLAAQYKNRPEFIYKELERIIPYFINKKIRFISRSELEKLLFIDRSGDIFTFLNALLTHDYKTLFSILDHLVVEDEVEIFIYQLRLATERLILIKSMPQIKSTIICQKLKLKPYYFQKLLSASRRLLIKQLKKIYQRCLKFDLAKEQGIFRNKKLAFSLFIFEELFSKEAH